MNRGITPLQAAEHYFSDCEMRVRQQQGIVADMEQHGRKNALKAGRELLLRTSQVADEALLFLRTAQKLAPPLRDDGRQSLSASKRRHPQH